MRIVCAIVSVFLFLVIFAGGILYTFNKTRVYTATGSIQIKEQWNTRAKSSTLSKDEDSPASKLRDDPDRIRYYVNTQIGILNSSHIIKGVDQRMRGELRDSYIAPYANYISIYGPLPIVEILASNRAVIPVKDSHIIKVAYTHPDPIVAAEVANLIMKEYIDYGLRQTIDAAMVTVEDLRMRVMQQKERVEALMIKFEEKKAEGTLSEVETTMMHNDLYNEKEFLTALENKMRTEMVQVNGGVRAYIIDEAVPPEQPSSPNVVMILTTSFAVGLAVGIVFYILSLVVFRRTRP